MTLFPMLVHTFRRTSNISDPFAGDDRISWDWEWHHHVCGVGNVELCGEVLAPAAAYATQATYRHSSFPLRSPQERSLAALSGKWRVEKVERMK
jgi:hypothetical protein